MEKRTTHINVKAPAPVVEALALRAKESDRTFSAEVRRALAAYVAAQTPVDDDPGGEAEVVGSSPVQVAGCGSRG